MHNANFMLLMLDSPRAHGAALRHTMLRRIQRVFAKQQVTWTGFQVTLPCEGSPRIKKPSFSLQVAKISSRDGNHLLYEPVDTRIVVKARENEFVPYKHTMVVSQDFRARFEAVKSALIRLSSPLNCSSGRLASDTPLLLKQSSKHFLRWLQSKLQSSVRMQSRVISCQYLVLLKSQKQISLIIERALTGIDSDTALILEDVDVLVKDKDGLNLQCLLSTLNDIADFRTIQGSFHTFIIGTTAEFKVHSDLHRHFPLQIPSPSQDSDVHVQQIRRDEGLKQIRLKVQSALSIGGHRQQKAMRIVPLSTSQQNNGNVRWDDVGGLEDIKAALCDMLKWPIKFPKLFKNYSKGALLHGPPGTGKTLIAKAASVESGLTFFNVKGPELLGMYVGESEKCVRELFNKARELAPALIFFDEFDSLCMVDAPPGTLISRVISQVVTELDSLKGSQVFVLAASNRLELIEPTILRSGRLDRVLHVPLQNDVRSKVAIFKALTKNFIFSSNFEIGQLALVSEDVSGADIYSACVRAWIKAAKRAIAYNSTGIVVQTMDFY